MRLVLAQKAADAQRRKRQEHRCARRIQRWLYRLVAILKHRSMLARRELRRQRQEEKKQRQEERQKLRKLRSSGAAAGEAHGNEKNGDAAAKEVEDDDDEDDDEDEEDEEAYALEAEEEEEENTFLTRFMQRSGSIGEKIMMMRTLSPMSGKEGKGLGAVAEHDEDGHGRDAIGGGSHEDESMDSGVDRITKVQARWHRAAQRHPTSIQKVLRGERTNERNEQNERIKRNERTNEPTKS